MELWELIARERIRDSLARYHWSGDALRLDELSETFCEDGELEIRGGNRARGRAGIIEFLRGTVATSGSAGIRIVRHNLVNVSFLELTPEQASVASYFTVFTEVGLDHYGRYRDTLVPVGAQWLIRHRLVSTDWHAPDSTMRPSPAHP